MADRTSRLEQICRISRVNPDSSEWEVCREILKRQSRRPSLLKKDDLLFLAQVLDVSTEPEYTKKYILEQLKQKIRENPGMEKKIIDNTLQDMEDEAVKKSVEENVKKFWRNNRYRKI